MWHSFTVWVASAGSIWLMILGKGKRFVKTQVLYARSEGEKVAISTSLRIALRRITVHLLPVSISTALIALNVVQVLNGPAISSVATFFLQVAAKFHEVFITGSLTAIVLDALRYEALFRDLNLGLLVSSFSMAGPNYLWSMDFRSAFDGKYWIPKRFWPFSLVLFSCLLVATVGPASALLMIPSYLWQRSGATEFYLGGTEDQLWPQQLTINNTGPSICQDTPSQLLAVCPFGGFQRLTTQFQTGSLTGFEISLNEKVPRTINGHSPTYGVPMAQQSSNETWAWAARGDINLMTNDLSYKYEISQSYATGRNKHRRDFVDGGYQISESKIPVCRAVCGPTVIMQNNTRNLPFPVLAHEHPWQDVSNGPLQGSGAVMDFQIDDLQDLSLPSTSNLAHARLVVLPSEFGAVTAAVAFVSSNSTHAVGRGCPVDCRWATGQTFRGANTILRAYSAHIGKPTQMSGSTYLPPDYTDFFDPHYLQWYGDTIQADQAWLDTAFPIYNATTYSNTNLTTFEQLLQPLLADPSSTVSTDAEIAWYARVNLEYITAVTFVDALARTGWHHSLQNNDIFVINPLLQQGALDNQKILNGQNLFSSPTNISYSVLNTSWYSYGVGWVLHSSGQYASVALLGIHIVAAIIHSFIILYRGEIIEAWDSVSKLLVLAWNSTPTRRDEEFENCSSGIDHVNTLQNSIKIAVIDEKQTEGRIELVVVDEKGNSRDGRPIRSVKKDVKYR